MGNESGSNRAGTQVRRQQLFRDRWSSYGKHSGILDLSDMLSPAELREFDLFASYDDDFLVTIAQDVSVARWSRGITLFEEGSYLDLAFVIAKGKVDVFLKNDTESSAAPIFDMQRTMFGAGPGVMKQASGDRGNAPTETALAGAANEITFLSAMDFDLPHGGLVTLRPGDIFGEIGALNGWPQSVTARTGTECTLIQIRLPALRAMKKESDAFRDKVDRTYRKSALLEQLKSAPLLRGTEERFLKWLTTRVDLVSHSPGDQITQQGLKAEAFYMVRSGFVKLAQRIEDADAAVSYLSKGMTLGAVELLNDSIEGWRSTATSVGYTELVRISPDDFQETVQKNPGIEKRLWEAAVAEIKDAGFSRANLDKSELIDFSLQKGLVQGNSILVIDLDVCTRCDDCMQGCADTHGGRPRFVREGDKFDQFMVARSCYHCEDPVCLIGCPTGAIRRAQVGEVVEIEDNLCIGCSNCANKCPYDAIVMHDTGKEWSQDAIPEHLRGRPRKVASKCDLCHTSDAGPACVNSCPHSCAFRIGSLEDFQALLAAGDTRPVGQA
ncbi:MAG: Fe-S-cluster-containing dehydrogenase component/CRP-like cAMP-binding protein [Rhodothermales bacterium]|jgi:Fe-S-cluster-containing dehydrogenase component/CRP-like cAMP-binding protein